MAPGAVMGKDVSNIVEYWNFFCGRLVAVSLLDRLMLQHASGLLAWRNENPNICGVLYSIEGTKSGNMRLGSIFALCQDASYKGWSEGNQRATQNYEALLNMFSFAL